jgi:hypothetical protein
MLPCYESVCLKICPPAAPSSALPSIFRRQGQKEGYLVRNKPHTQMNFGAIDKENIAEAFANVRLFSPSRSGGGAKHPGGILERSLLKSQAAAPSAFHGSDSAARAILATPAHSHHLLSTSSSSLACAPKRAPLLKKTGLSERARRTPLFSAKDSAAGAHSCADAQGAAQLCSAGISKGSR